MTTNLKQSLKKRVKVEPVKNREELTALAISTAELEMEREKAALIRDQRIAALAEESNITIEEIGRQITANTKRMQAWAVANRETEFAGKQAIRVAGHKLAFREGTGAVEFTPGVTADDVIEAIVESEDEAELDRFVVIKATLSKAAVIAAWKAGGEAWERLQERGCRVVKKEKFSFEADRDALADVATVKD